MHPAVSIIIFTVASGAGYGVLFLLGLFNAYAGWVAAPGTPAPFGLGGSLISFVALVIALLVVSAGLISSAFHLGRPERALLAFTQWRTSWLSREACLALATFVPALGLGYAWWSGGATGAWGALLAAGALATVYATSMIYRSIDAVPRWSTPWTPAVYLVFAGSNGVVRLAFLVSLTSAGLADAVTLAGVSVLFIAVAAAVKGGYWRAIGVLTPDSTLATATGLAPEASAARIRPLDPPHTEPNWLLKEMAYQVARRHVKRLRALTWALAFALPGALCAAVWLAGEPAGAAGVLALRIALTLAVLIETIGTLIERWLFFAEAEHKMALYYGHPLSSPVSSS